MNFSIESKTRSKLVIVGAAGRLGAALLENYSASNPVTGLTRAELNLADPESIRRALEPMEYDRLILPGALTAVDYCESHEDEAFAVNADGPKLIAEISAEKGAHVTYISTDFVFGGLSEGAYTEERVPKPLSVYGASKLEGEEAVLGASPDNLVARVSWLYGAGKPAFPEWIIQQAMKQDTLALPEEKTGIPTYTGDVVDYLRLLVGLDDGGNPAGGIYHLSNSGYCTWQQWGQFCLDQAAAAGLPLKTRVISANCLEDIVAFVAKRPINSILSTDKFTRRTGVVPRSWQDAMREHFDKTLATAGL
ncbi:MAG: sugar nucleotide-binding protein [Verrucomicrobiota bacterium]